MKRNLSRAAVVLLACVLFVACVKGQPTDGPGGPVVRDATANTALTALKQIDIDLNIAIDIVWSLRTVGVVTKEEYGEFDVAAVKTNAGVRTARDAVWLYLDQRAAGAVVSGFQGLVTLAENAYAEIETLKTTYEARAAPGGE